MLGSGHIVLPLLINFYIQLVISSHISEPSILFVLEWTVGAPSID